MRLGVVPPLTLSLTLLLACVGPTPSGAGRAADGDPKPQALVELDVDEAAADAPLAPVVQAPRESLDLIIVGAGPAGLAAAVAAQERGARLRVLERQAQPGGALRWAGGLMLMAGTSTQLLAGVHDAPADLLADWRPMTGGDPSRPWVRRFADDGAVQVHDWLQDLGLGFQLTDALDPGASALRVHAAVGGGPALAEGLLSALDADDILLETEVVGLIFTESGRCVGVAIHDAEGEGWLRAGAVLLATGGFSRDLDRVAWANPELPIDKLAFAGAPWTDGNGHALLEAAGAAWQNPRAVGLYAHGVADPRAPKEELTVAHLEDSLWVNRDGRRFFGEDDAGGFAAGPALLRQPEHQGWAIVDDALWRRMGLVDAMPIEAEAPPSLAELVAAGAILEAAEPADLAAALLMDPSAITAELETWNAAFDDGAPDRFRGSPPPVALQGGPWRALPLQAALAKSFGGIAVDGDGRVVDADGAPLPGLYAAGELTGMAGGSLVGDRGFTGSLSAVLLSGRVAGDAAAAALLDR